MNIRKDIKVAEYSGNDMEDGENTLILKNEDLFSDLQKRSQYLEFVFHNAPQGIICCDEEGCIIDVNAMFCMIFGFERSDILGKRINDIVAQSEEVKKDVDSISKEIHSGKSVSKKTYRNRKDGSLFPVSVTSFPFDISGQPFYHYAYCDMSSLVDSENRMKRRAGLEKLMPGLFSRFENSRNLDEATRISLAELGTFMGATSCDIYFSSKNNGLMKPGYEWTIPEEEPLSRRLLKISEGKQLLLWEKIRETGSGNIRIGIADSELDEMNREILALASSSSLLVIPFPAGTKTYGLLIFENIPSDSQPDSAEMSLLQIFVDFLGNVFFRFHSEKDLKRKHARYYSIVDDQLDFVNTMDPEYRITFGNIAFCNYFDISRNEIVGKNFLELLPDMDRRSMEEQLLGLSKETPISVTEGRTVLPSGGVIWQQWISKGIFDEEGDLIEILGVGRDITRRKRIEDELKTTIGTLKNNFEATINGMGKIIEIKDPYTAGHQQNVALLARRIAEEMHLSQDQIESVYYASLVHDIGKIQIPSEILNKPGKLNELEYSLVKSHPIHSSEIMKTVEFPWPIADIVLQHHERINGAGYPNGVKGEDLVIEARIMGVADVVEAMSAHRPYRISLGIEKALEEIEAYSGVLYDPGVVKICVSLFREKDFSFKREKGSAQGSKHDFA